MTSLYESGDFETFWRAYVGLHSRTVTQRMHAAASLAFLSVVAIAVVSRKPQFLVLAPLADYLIAQASHRLFEANRTTPWKNPLWHARAEFRMLGLVLRGRAVR